MQNFIKISAWFVLPIAMGILLLLFGVALMGLLAVFFYDNRYFGLPMQPLMMLEDFLAWVPLGLILGGIVGYFSKTHPVSAGLIMAVSAILFLTIQLILDQGFSLNRDAFFSTLTFLMKTAGPFMLLSSTIGASLGSRIKNQTVNR